MTAAHTPPLAVWCAGAVKAAATAAARVWADAGGRPADFSFGTAGGLGQRLQEGGELTPDVLIASRPVLDGLAAAGVVRPATVISLCRVGVGIAIREGDTTPDVSTPDGLRAALLGARGVACSDAATGDSSGLHFADVLRRLGIAEAMAGRLVPARLGLEVAEHVLHGKAELGATQASVIVSCPGIRLAGMLPDELQHHTTYAAGVPTSATNLGAAQSFLALLGSGEGAQIFAASGFSLA